MLAVVQRVKEAAVTVAGEVKAAVGPGLLVLLGVAVGDKAADAEYLADKIVKLRLFPGRSDFDKSVQEIGGDLLVVSQFTLLAAVDRGRRPSFSRAAPAEIARPLYQAFIAALRRRRLSVAEGVFQAKMAVNLINDGPVTLIIESRQKVDEDKTGS